MLAPLQTLDDIREAFETSGLAISEWADTHGFRRGSVYAVLAGRTKGRRGEAHRVAQALGLKAKAPTADVEMLLRNPNEPRGDARSAGAQPIPNRRTPL
ncbi:DNA-binding protein [Lysobacter sp. A286]